MNINEVIARQLSKKRGSGKVKLNTVKVADTTANVVARQLGRKVTPVTVQVSTTQKSNIEEIIARQISGRGKITNGNKHYVNYSAPAEAIKKALKAEFAEYLKLLDAESNAMEAAGTVDTTDESDGSEVAITQDVIDQATAAFESAADAEAETAVDEKMANTMDLGSEVAEAMPVTKIKTSRKKKSTSNLAS